MPNKSILNVSGKSLITLLLNYGGMIVARVDSDVVVNNLSLACRQQAEDGEEPHPVLSPLSYVTNPQPSQHPVLLLPCSYVPLFSCFPVFMSCWSYLPLSSCSPAPCFPVLLFPCPLFPLSLSHFHLSSCPPVPLPLVLLSSCPPVPCPPVPCPPVPCPLVPLCSWAGLELCLLAAAFLGIRPSRTLGLAHSTRIGVGMNPPP